MVIMGFFKMPIFETPCFMISLKILVRNWYAKIFDSFVCKKKLRCIADILKNLHVAFLFRASILATLASPSSMLIVIVQGFIRQGSPSTWKNIQNPLNIDIKEILLFLEKSKKSVSLVSMQFSKSMEFFSGFCLWKNDYY